MPNIQSKNMIQKVVCRQSIQKHDKKGCWPQQDVANQISFHAGTSWFARAALVCTEKTWTHVCVIPSKARACIQTKTQNTNGGKETEADTQTQSKIKIKQNTSQKNGRTKAKSMQSNHRRVKK